MMPRYRNPLASLRLFRLSLTTIPLDGDVAEWSKALPC